MSGKEHSSKYLTLEQAKQLPSESERLFAVRCILAGCILEHQISVGSSVIDFLVHNPKRKKGSGKLVEVSLLKRAGQDGFQKTSKKKRKKKRIRERKSDTLQRKQRQIAAMQASGLPWTILYNEHIIRLKKTAEQESL